VGFFAHPEPYAKDAKFAQLTWFCGDDPDFTNAVVAGRLPFGRDFGNTTASPPTASNNQSVPENAKPIEKLLASHTDFGCFCDVFNNTKDQRFVEYLCVCGQDTLFNDEIKKGKALQDETSEKYPLDAFKGKPFDMAEVCHLDKKMDDPKFYVDVCINGDRKEIENATKTLAESLGAQTNGKHAYFQGAYGCHWRRVPDPSRANFYLEHHICGLADDFLESIKASGKIPGEDDA